MKRTDNLFEGALIIDQKFTRSASGKSAGDLFQKLAGALLVAQSETAEEIAITIGVLTKAEVDRMERKAARDKEIMASEIEAQEVERLKAAVKRLADAIAKPEAADAAGK
jgi:hypothetical protein